MTLRHDVLLAILAMAAAAYACRAGGYFMMGYVRITPRVEAFLKSIPISLVAAMLSVAAVRGSPPEWLGLATAIAIMAVSRNQFLAAVLGCATVATARALGVAAI